MPCGVKSIGFSKMQFLMFLVANKLEKNVFEKPVVGRRFWETWPGSIPPRSNSGGQRGSTNDFDPKPRKFLTSKRFLRTSSWRDSSLDSGDRKPQKWRFWENCPGSSLANYWFLKSLLLVRNLHVLGSKSLVEPLWPPDLDLGGIEPKNVFFGLFGARKPKPCRFLTSKRFLRNQ